LTKFLDAHEIHGFDEEGLRRAQQSPTDEFGVKHENILYNKEDDKLFCLLDALDKASSNISKIGNKM
jgi:hypothetical protein